jgi:hypothetical protein
LQDPKAIRVISSFEVVRTFGLQAKNKGNPTKRISPSVFKFFTAFDFSFEDRKLCDFLFPTPKIYQFLNLPLRPKLLLAFAIFFSKIEDTC